MKIVVYSCLNKVTIHHHNGDIASIWHRVLLLTFLYNYCSHAQTFHISNISESFYYFSSHMAYLKQPILSLMKCLLHFSTFFYRNSFNGNFFKSQSFLPISKHVWYAHKKMEDTIWILKPYLHLQSSFQWLILIQWQYYWEHLENKILSYLHS